MRYLMVVVLHFALKLDIFFQIDKEKCKKMLFRGHFLVYFNKKWQFK